MIAHPNGDLYVTDGYRNARVHRFTRDGRLVKSWGEPGHGAGQFHLPHSVAFDDDGKLYVADRSNKRIQIFTPEGDYIGQWTGMGGPNDITRGKDGNFYIAEQEDDGKPAQVCVRDGQGNVPPAWRAATSTASASTRRATSTPASPRTAASTSSCASAEQRSKCRAEKRSAFRQVHAGQWRITRRSSALRLLAALARNRHLASQKHIGGAGRGTACCAECSADDRTHRTGARSPSRAPSLHPRDRAGNWITIAR